MVADLCHVVLSGFRGEKAPRENPPNAAFFVFSHGDLSPRHTKVRQFHALRFRLLFIFAWRGERSPICAMSFKRVFGANMTLISHHRIHCWSIIVLYNWHYAGTPISKYS